LWLATSHHVGLHRLPPVLRDFTRAHPAVELDVRFMESEEACRAVAHGDVDLAVVTLPQTPEPRLNAAPVWEDTLLPVAARDHPLASARHPRLSGYDAILPPPDTFTRQIIDAALKDRGIAPRRTLEATYLETIRMLVSIGMGWS